MEPLSKSVIATVSLAAIIGAVAKVAIRRMQNPRELVFSALTSMCVAFLAFFVGLKLGLDQESLIICVWLGAYMGKEFVEVVVEAATTVINKRAK